ncbi:nucleotide pyrophosphohydrolase [Kitasatospora sp. NPDC048194]|uniref:nucleotide pyrophosphohydrolase n=1 Tax=Kitasatospora sp. NPDC048194 TaxID=3364045 RepID=UPI00371AD8DD
MATGAWEAGASPAAGQGGESPGAGQGGESPGAGQLTLEGLRLRLVEFAAARRWEPYHTPKNLAAALSVEAGELLEIFQWLTPEQAAAVMSDPERAHRVRDEVADVLAYLLQFCTTVGVDPLEALAAKIDRNEHRFPVPGVAADVNHDEA